MTVDDSHPELFPEEAGVGSGVLPPFEELFDTPEFSLKLLESLISVAVDPATPEPEVDLIPGDSTDPGVASATKPSSTRTSTATATSPSPTPTATASTTTPPKSPPETSPR